MRKIYILKYSNCILYLVMKVLFSLHAYSSLEHAIIFYDTSVRVRVQLLNEKRFLPPSNVANKIIRRIVALFLGDSKAPSELPSRTVHYRLIVTPHIPAVSIAFPSSICFIKKINKPLYKI